MEKASTSQSTPEKPPSKSQVKQILRRAVLSSDAYGTRVDSLSVDITGNEYMVEVSYVLNLPKPSEVTPSMAEERAAKTAIHVFSPASEWNIEKGFIQVLAWVPVDFDSAYTCYDPNGQVGARDTTGFISQTSRYFKQIRSTNWATYEWNTRATVELGQLRIQSG